MRTSRRIGWWTVGLLGALFAVLAAALVPWDPVPGGPLALPDPEQLFTPEEIARGEHVGSWARAWSLSSLTVGLVVACVLGFTRLGPRLVARLRGPRWLVVVQTVAAVMVIGRLVTLPFAFALHRLFVDAGLSPQGPLSWLWDVAKAEAVQVLVTAVVVLVVMGCACRWRRAWPLVAGGFLATLVVAGSFAYPVLVEPAFNNFRPLPDGPLRDEVYAVAEQEGVVVNEVLVADASRRTTTLNAYVSGMWGSRRVVLYDNLVEQVPPDEVLAVVAHEVAHARHRDVLVGTALGAVGAAWSVGLLALLLRRRRLDDPAVVPWLLAMVTIATLLSTPIQSTISRQVEMRADVDALKATGDPVAFEEMQVLLAQRALADPTPPSWSQFVFGTHPTVLERVAVARRLGAGD